MWGGGGGGGVGRRSGIVFLDRRKVEKNEDVPLVEFMYLVFTRMPCESYRRRLRSLLFA